MPRSDHIVDRNTECRYVYPSSITFKYPCCVGAPDVFKGRENVLTRYRHSVIEIYRGLTAGYTTSPKGSRTSVRKCPPENLARARTRAIKHAQSLR